MGSVVKSLDKAINSMELQKISAVMDKFEQQFEDLDVHTSVSGISSSYGVSMTSRSENIYSTFQSYGTLRCRLWKEQWVVQLLLLRLQIKLMI